MIILCTLTYVCQVDAGQNLIDLKRLMLNKQKYTTEPVYGIFNGQLYIAYSWMNTPEQIEKY